MDKQKKQNAREGPDCKISKMFSTWWGTNNSSNLQACPLHLATTIVAMFHSILTVLAVTVRPWPTPEEAMTPTLRFAMRVIMAFSTIMMVDMVLAKAVVEAPIEVAESIDPNTRIIKKLIRISSTVFIKLFHHRTSATTSTTVLMIG